MAVSPSALPRRLSAEDRREQILAAAARLFIGRGFESVTVADLAQELQTSRPTIYTYFPSTEAMLDALLERRLGDLLASLGPLLAELPPAPGERRIIPAVFGLLAAQSDTLRLLHSGGAPTFQARRNAFLTELGDRLTALLPPESLVRRDPHLLLLLTSLLDALALRVTTDPALDVPALTRSLSTFVLGGARALVGEGEEV